MPHKVTYTHDAGVVTEYEGEVTGDEVIEIHRGIVDDPSFELLRYYISDGTGRTRAAVSADQARVMAGISKSASKLNPNLLVAMVRPEDVDFGMSRMYQSLLEDSDFRIGVFRTRAEAGDWVASLL